MKHRLTRPAFSILMPVLLCLFTQFAAGQKGAQRITRFSGDSTKFITELNIVFAPVVANEEKMCETEMKGFIQKWNAEKYDPRQKQLIYAIANSMLKRGLKPFPDFHNYIRALNVFIDSHQPEDRFYEWFSVMKGLLENKNSRYFLQFVEQTIILFGENLLYKSLTA